MKKQSKILTLILSAVLMLAVAVIAVGARGESDTAAAVVDGVKYETFDKAFEAVSETGGTIKLLEDLETESTYSVSSDIVIDLAGHEFTVYENAFVVSSSVNFTVKGTGTINAHATFIETVVNADAPKISVRGDSAPMYVNYYGASGNPFIKVNGADLKLENLEIRSYDVPNYKTTFATADASNAVVTFDNVNLIAAKHLGQNSSVIDIRGKSCFKLYNSSFMSNTAVVNVATSNTGMMLEAENTQLINRATSTTDRANETGVIGVYTNFSGKMYFKNSLIEASYRPILLKGNINGLITLDASVLKHTQGRSSAPIRTANMLFINGSHFVVGRTMTVFSDTSEYRSNVDFELGTRVNFYVYDVITKGLAPEVRVAVKLNGEENYTYIPYGDSDDYIFIYDPIGDPDVPYVLVDKYERNEDGSYKVEDGKKIMREYTAYNTGTLVHYATGASLPEGLIWQDQKYSISLDASYEFPDKTFLTWNKGAGTFTGYTYGGNAALRYESSGSKTQNSISFTTVGTKYNAAPVMVFELDFATDSELGFTNGTFSINVRNTSGGSGGVNNQRIRISDNGIAIFEASPDVKYELDKSVWHKITVVFYTDTTITDTDLTAETSGKSYYYLDGELIGTSVAYTKNAGNVFGFRFDTNAGTEKGTSLLVDNVMVRTFDNYINEEEDLENTSPDSYLLNGGRASELPIGVMGVYSVGGKRFDTLDEATAAAESAGSYVTLLDNVTTPLKVTKPCTVIANGYTIALTDDSMSASVKLNPDGSNYSYTFSERFYGLEVKYEWFIGDVNSVEELKDPSKYVISTVTVGESPEFTGTIDITEKSTYVGYDDVFIYTLIGWSRTPDSREMDPLTPLSVSDAVNNKNGSVKLFPVYGYKALELGYTWVVTDTYGNLLYDDNGKARGGSDNASRYKSFWTNTVKLKDGETIHLLADMTACSLVFFESPGADALPYGFNVNGHTLNIDATLQNYGYGNRLEGVFSAPEGTTLNVYSGFEGGLITARGYKQIKTVFTATPEVDTVDHSQNDYTITGGIIFRMNTDNSTINVGDVRLGQNDYSGKNLTVMGDCLAYGKWGTNSEVNVGGITFIRTSNVYPAVIETSTTNGSINVDGASFILAAGGTLVGNDSEGDKYSASINLNDSLIVVKNNGDNVVRRSVGKNTISIDGCVTNATLNAGDNTYVGDGTLAYASDFKFKEGFFAVDSASAMSLGSVGENGTVKVWVYNTTAKHGNLDSFEFVISEAGGTSANLVLPALSVNVISKDDAIAFTFLGLNENEAKILYFAPGSKVDSIPEIDSAELTYVRLVHDGTFDKKIPRYATENLTFTPGYTMESKLTGMKTSVTLYTDLIINIYIPKECESAIDGILLGGKIAEYTDAELDGEAYLKISVRMIPSDAAQSIELLMTLNDSGYTGTVSVSTSIGEYAESVLSDKENYTLVDRRLVYAMIAYVNESAIYARGEGSEKLESLIEAYTEVGVNYNGLTPPLDNVPQENEMLTAMTDNELLTEIFMSAKVRLSATPVFVFTVRRGFVGTVSITYGSFNREYVIETPKDRTITLDASNAAEFGKIIHISVSGAIDGETVEFADAKYNLATYLQYHLDNVAADGEKATESQLSSERAVPVIKALLSYVMAADEYRESLLDAPDESVDSSDEYVPEGDTPLGDVFIDG